MPLLGKLPTLSRLLKTEADSDGIDGDGIDV
jgi:hypothetical protein